jgi:hypothetical protein
MGRGMPQHLLGACHLFGQCRKCNTGPVSACLREVLLNDGLIIYHRDERDVEHMDLTSVQRSGQAGRPKIKINDAFLREAFSDGRNITITEVAELLGVHRNTVQIKLKQLGIKARVYTDIDDAELDGIMRTFLLSHPDAGYPYCHGHLRSIGIKIQKRRIQDSLRRTKDLARFLEAVMGDEDERRDYSVKRPHSVWHIDGHHKLIRYGIIIHGIVDGYSRQVSELGHCGYLSTLLASSLLDGLLGHQPQT